MQEFLVAALLMVLLFIIVVIAIIRWIMRVNVRVRLLEQINSKLQILIDQSCKAETGNNTENQPNNPKASDSNHKLTDFSSTPSLVKKTVTEAEAPPKRPAVLRVDCPHCKAEFDVPQDYIGHNAKCAKCRKQFTVKLK